jgi:hypothetical protein
LALISLQVITVAKLRNYSYRKRQFLNPLSAEHDSYISVICESSDGGTNALGTNLVTIADCRRVIQLEFPLGYSSDRRLSLAKADLLIRVLTDFRDALRKESKMIAKNRS